MKYHWWLYPTEPTEDPVRFSVPEIVTEGDTLEEAYSKVQIPEGKRILCWWPEDDVETYE